jgi:hypothetical protein
LRPFQLERKRLWSLTIAIDAFGTVAAPIVVASIANIGPILSIIESSWDTHRTRCIKAAKSLAT